MTQKLPKQGYAALRLMSSLQDIYGGHHELVDRYKIFISQIINDIFFLLRGYHTLQGDNSLKSVERFDHMMFVCRFQASR